jgi:glycosyltransferase involved in cell wall biosynthesis
MASSTTPSSPPPCVRIVDLLADYGTAFNPSFFGQFSLIQDLALAWQRQPVGGRELPVEHWYVGSHALGPRCLAASEPDLDPRAYAPAIERLCEDGAPVVVFAHFVHKDAVAVAGLRRLRVACPWLRVVVVLHCTRDEFTRPALEPRSTANPDPPSPRAVRSLQRARAFRDLLARNVEPGLVDRFVAVSHAAFDSYVAPASGPDLPAERVLTIPNGVDASLYRPLSPAQRAAWRDELGLPPGLVIGWTQRWTQAKGKDVLEALLDRLEQRVATMPTTFLLPLLVHDDLFCFLDALPERYPRLYEQNRVRCYLDISRQARALAHAEPAGIEEALRATVSGWSPKLLRVFDRSFVGLLRRPVHPLLDWYLRPSVAEAFGLGTVEAHLCGVPTLASDRGGCAELVLPRHQVAFPPALALLGPSNTQPEPAYQRACNEAADAFLALLDADDRPPPADLRRMVLERGHTTERMLEGYRTMVEALLDEVATTPVGKA